MDMVKYGIKNIGVMDFANKDKYEGQWVDDKMNGNGCFYLQIGKYYYADGDEF